MEKLALGSAYSPTQDPWNLGPTEYPKDPNVPLLLRKLEETAMRCRENFRKARSAPARQHQLYQDFALFYIYYRFRKEFLQFIERAYRKGHASGRIEFYERFKQELDSFLRPTGDYPPATFSYSQYFAYGFQVRRAFYHIFHYIIGTSAATRDLRARVWQSTFTHDIARYFRSLSNRMGDIITLITGPSGSGKELVAQGIGLSRFIPFNESKQRFEEDFINAYYPLNLTALSPTLIESELFGHSKGSFTGAMQDREGYFEKCGPYGTVFLDEIGDVDSKIQVKLLRTLQTRSFQRLGDTEPRCFQGKILAATNRNLVTEIRNGTFREDFYYRLCADNIRTSGLREILAEDPNEYHYLVRFIAEKIAGVDEADQLTEEVITWIDKELPPGYHWPGNFRELEQCVRNILIHKDYQPQNLDYKARNESGEVALNPENTNLTADQLLRRHATKIYAQTRNYEETARQLKLDRRTVKKYIDTALLEKLIPNLIRYDNKLFGRSVCLNVLPASAN